MILEFFLKIVGWVLVLIPLSVFLVISYSMIKSVSKEDGMVNKLLMLGTTLFFTGGILLILLYLTDFFPAILQLFG